MRGYVRCERCDWSRFYSKLTVGRIPVFCPACGKRVVRERSPSPDSPTIARWKAVADQLSPKQPPPG